jgi:hypothetical protein
MNSELVGKIENLINEYSRENISNTPDFILALYLMRCLEAFETAVKNRDAWYGVRLEPGSEKS